jgi:sugar-specific transcriptional regulator TrmB
MKKQNTIQNITVRTLQDMGLSEGEAILYMLMLEYPKSTVQELTIKSPFPRTMLYYLLKKLEEKGLISSKKEKWKTLYLVGDPEKLYELLKNKETEFEKQKQSIKELIPHLRQSFHLKNKRPSIKVFEGLEAYEKILEDSLLKGIKEVFVYEHFYTQKP